MKLVPKFIRNKFKKTAGKLETIGTKGETLSVYLCFSHADKGFTEKIHQSLIEDGRTINVDWEDTPPSNDWLDEMHKLIERSDVFVIVLSPSSISSEMCNWELTHALKNGKRIVPVVCGDIDYTLVRKELAPMQWVLFKKDLTDYKTSIRGLRKYIDQEKIHTLLHTQLLNSAIEWERNDFEKSLLLHSKDLKVARNWLTNSSLGKLPKPTTLHLSYVTASYELHKSNIKRRIIALFFVFVVIVSIAWPSWGVFFFCLIFAHLFAYFASH